MDAPAATGPSEKVRERVLTRRMRQPDIEDAFALTVW
jgi:hypothetical protein